MPAPQGRLAPLFACLLLGVPWLVADALRTTRVLSLGVAMNLKQACLVTGVVLAVGATGVAPGGPVCGVTARLKQPVLPAETGCEMHR